MAVLKGNDPHRLRTVLLLPVLALVAAACQLSTFTGDSLLVGAQPEITAQLKQSGVAVTTREYPGTSLCDFLADLTNPSSSAYVAKQDFTLMEFAGNNYTPCVRSPAGRLMNDALVAKMRADTLRLIAAMRGKPLYIVTAPAIRPDLRPTNLTAPAAPTSPSFPTMVADPRIIAMYFGLQAQFPTVHVIDAGAQMNLPGGGYNPAVHGSDGVHLTSSGYLTYARYIASRVKVMQHLS